MNNQSYYHYHNLLLFLFLLIACISYTSPLLSCSVTFSDTINLSLTDNSIHTATVAAREILFHLCEGKNNNISNFILKDDISNQPVLCLEDNKHTNKPKLYSALALNIAHNYGRMLVSNQDQFLALRIVYINTNVPLSLKNYKILIRHAKQCKNTEGTYRFAIIHHNGTEQANCIVINKIDNEIQHIVTNKDQFYPRKPVNQLIQETDLDNDIVKSIYKNKSPLLAEMLIKQLLLTNNECYKKIYRSYSSSLFVLLQKINTFLWPLLCVYIGVQVSKYIRLGTLLQ